MKTKHQVTNTGTIEELDPLKNSEGNKKSIKIPSFMQNGKRQVTSEDFSVGSSKDLDTYYIEWLF